MRREIGDDLGGGEEQGECRLFVETVHGFYEPGKVRWIRIAKKVQEVSQGLVGDRRPSGMGKGGSLNVFMICARQRTDRTRGESMLQ